MGAEADNTMVLGRSMTTAARQTAGLAPVIAAGLQGGCIPKRRVVTRTDVRLVSPDTILDEYGERPLHKAFSGKMEQVLIAVGADVNAQNRFGEPPVFMARRAALKVLLEAGANAGIIGKFGQTALHRHHTADEVRLLLAAGAHDNAEDENGRTPLDYALDDKNTIRGRSHSSPH